MARAAARAGADPSWTAVSSPRNTRSEPNTGARVALQLPAVPTCAVHPQGGSSWCCLTPSHLMARGCVATPNGCCHLRSCFSMFFTLCCNLVYLLFLFLRIKNRWFSLSSSPNLPLFSLFSLPAVKLLPVTLALVPLGAVPRMACWQHVNLRSGKVGATASQEQLM